MATRDYARQQRRPEPQRRAAGNRQRRPAAKAAARSGIPLWAWLLAGISVILFAASLYFVSRPVAPLAMAPSSEAKAGLPKQKVVEIPPKQPSRFDFYEMLPSYEVVVPDEVINPPKPKPQAKTAAVPPATPGTTPAGSTTDGVNTTAPADITSGSAVLQAGKPAAAAGAEGSATSSPASTPKPAASAASSTPRPPPQPTATLAQGERFQVQAAAYRSKADAEEKRAALALSGIAMHLEPATLPNGETWYRVRSAPLGSAAAAAQMQAAVREQGFSAVVVKVQQ